MLLGVAGCFEVQCVVVCGTDVWVCCNMLQCFAVFCSMLQGVQYNAVCCSVLQCVAACCSVLQRVAV